LSKYKHLGKAGTQDHIDAVMSVFRRSVIDEIQKIIRSLDDCLLDITSGAEQEEEKTTRLNPPPYSRVILANKGCNFIFAQLGCSLLELVPILHRLLELS
jgi:hypothetical protein